MTGAGHAVVIVSGGDAISPFTTPTAACGQGLAAGSTDTALRAALLAAGYPVYTSPANAGPGRVTVDSGFGGFADAPAQPPASMTVNSIGPIDTAAEHLAAFLGHLQQAYDVEIVHLVGHSMGGLFARGAIRELADNGSSPRIRSLTTIGTPWEGAFAADYANGDLPLSAAGAHVRTAGIMVEFKKQVDTMAPGASIQVTRRSLTRPGGWNDRQAGVLDAIPVSLIGGDHFHSSRGPADVWPHDGLVTLGSALATGVPTAVLPHRTAVTFHDVHSLFFARAFDLPHHRALTWDPEAHEAVIASIQSATLSE